MEISIIIPDRIFLKDSVKEVILPTLTGQMGILKGHIPLLTGLDTGLILIKKSDSNTWIPIVTMGGFALVNDDKVTVLVNEAELGSEVNTEEAQSSFTSAKIALESITDEKKKIELLSQFKKARARVQALEQVKSI